MKKKRYNSKSRTVSNVEIDDSTTKEVTVDIEHHADKYNSCNALVLPSKKRKTKNITRKESTTKLLSKKRRKQLEKVIERKQKKLKTAKLLEELAKVQVPTAELQQYVSFTSIQNKGLKRHFRELEAAEPKLKHEVDKEEEPTKKLCINSIKGSNKKKVLERRLACMNNTKQNNEVKCDPKITVIGFEKHNYYYESSSSDESNANNETKFKISVSNNAANPETVINEIHNKNNLTKDAEDKSVLKKKQEMKKDDISTKNMENKTIPNKKECKKPTKVVQPTSIISKDRTPAVFVPLNRKPEIQAARLKLPIAGEEYDIVNMINENPVVIITGETGSGKTTQVPQYLYERGYTENKMIGITEPRRIAAMSMSKRVAEEMNLSKSKISYQIRFEGNVTEDTKIKFMTDGVLLKEIQNDFLLTKYSVIILDEAHERTIMTDILVGLLSRIVPLRNKRNNPLKLIIMSATLRVQEFVENTKLFKVKPPVFHIHTRQYEVVIHFNRRTNEDYVNDALHKTMMIHTRLPEGGILVFLTGQREVETVVHKLRKAFPLRKNNKSSRVKRAVNKTISKETSDKENSESNDSDSENALKEVLQHHKARRKMLTYDLKPKSFKLSKINLDDYSVIPTDQEDLTEDVYNFDEEDEDDVNLARLNSSQPMWVLPLYALLPAHEQAKIFKPPPEGCRLCVVCTNVAETSLTIPNIKYVVDSGRCKEKVYDKMTGVSMFQTSYVSKAAAMQRTGRAGRTGPGHCYRLYSSAVYNEFEEYNEADILKKPIDDLLLQLKAMNIEKVVNFPFPTPPDIKQLEYAEKRLTILELLMERPSKRAAARSEIVLTPLGKRASSYPVAPRYGKMLALSHCKQNLLKYTICMVAALSVQQVLIDPLNTEDSDNDKWLQIRHQWAGDHNSLLLGDLMVLLKAITFAEDAASQNKSLIAYCEENGLQHKAIVEVRKLRQQLTNEINLKVPDLNLTIDPQMPPPTDLEALMLRQIVFTGLTDQVARKVSPDEVTQVVDQSKWRYAYKTPEMESPVYMQRTSVLRNINPKWVVYQEIYESKRMYMRGVMAIEPQWLPKFAPTLCRLSEPLADPPPRYNEVTGKVMCSVKGTFGKAAWALPLVEIEYPLNVDGVKWFLYFFLDGEVCPKLKKFVPSLLSTPSSVTKIWAKLVSRIQDITQVMVTYKIMTKEKLLETWGSDKQFLLSHYQMWLPKSLHTEVALMWPPL